MKRLLLASLAASGFALAAHATPLTGTFNISIYQGTGNGTSTDPLVQANLTNPLFGTTPVGTLSYTGALNFDAGSATTIGGFLATGGGVITGSFPGAADTLSTAPFGTTTLFSITGSNTEALTGSVTHDDGASLYSGSGNAVVFDSSSPTSVTSTGYTLPGGSFDLVYVEANGAPAVLDFNVTSVPEPMSIAILGVGLIGLGVMSRRKSGSAGVA